MEGREQQRIKISNSTPQRIGVGNAHNQKIALRNTYTITVGADPYKGEYVITPSREQQVLQTKHLSMSENVVIKPIPQNYGMISYNGFELTIT